MKSRILKLAVFISTLIIGIVAGIYLRHNDFLWTTLKRPFVNSFQSENNAANWKSEFDIIDIISSVDSTLQKSYCYKSKSKQPQPLIVSLHTWSGNYAQYDPIAGLSLEQDLNYIHPDFRGPNDSIDTCCSDLVISDIDDAISYAIANFNVDRNRIYIIGFSGGGYATLSTFMKSKHNIRAYSAWASISDLQAWYNESKLRDNGYANNILHCTGYGEELDIEAAKAKSPLYWATPIAKLNNQKLHVYAGVYDGIRGSVPITHSINFYNKVLEDLSVQDSTAYVSASETLDLLEKREALENLGTIAGRKICLKKNFDNISLQIFEGDHEILPEFALNNLMEIK